MAQQSWRAVIMTQSNRLEVVEFVSPNNNREDAAAQCMTMFAAKDIKSLNPSASYGSSSLGSSGRSLPKTEASWTQVFLLFLVFLFLAFWPYFLLAGAAYGIYRLIKRFK